MTILALIEKEYGRFLHPLPKIVVAVSGGADSLALLHLLRQIVGRKKLVVAHLDHGWRETSAADADFVRQTAAAWGIPFHGLRLAHDSPEKGLEAFGRQERYRFLAQVARCERAAHVAVGHHQQDQAETVLMHLIRGTGLTGLRGMAFATRLNPDSQLTIIRPLLSVTRAQIEAYCQAHHLTPRQDETNRDPTFLRNRIRHQLLPLLQTYSAQFESHLLQLSHIVAADSDYLNQAGLALWQELQQDRGSGWLTLHLEKWQTAPLALQRRLLRMAVQQLNGQEIEIGFQTVTDALHLIAKGAFGHQYKLPGQTTLLIQDSTLLFKTPDADMPQRWPMILSSEKQALAIPTRVTFDSGWQLLIKQVEQPNFEQIFHNQNKWVAYITPVKGTLTLRTRQAGDRIRPLGMNGRSRKLKKVMSERHIPQAVRHHWPLILFEAEIIWVPGLIQAEPLRLKGEERSVICLKFLDNPIDDVA